MRPQVQRWPLSKDQVHFDGSAKEDQSPASGQVIVKQLHPLLTLCFWSVLGGHRPVLGPTPGGSQ